MVPKGIVSTRWPAVEATCRVGFKVTFDPWQAGAGRAILGRGKDHLYCADAVVLSIPRQVGKTFLIGSIVFALSIIDPKTLTLWTAHHGRTAADTFRGLKAFAQRPEVSHHVAQVFDSANDQRIVFKNGSTIAFGARERGFGRGFKKVGILVFDEAQILTENAIDAMVPTTNRHPNPLILYIGTPPKPSDPGQVFTDLRADALSGESDTTFYLEFSADDEADDPRDREQWAKANPSYPKHTSARAMLRMLKNLSADSFWREGLGRWDGLGKASVFGAGAWGRLSTDLEPPAPAALGVAADLDQVWLAASAASMPVERTLPGTRTTRTRRHLGSVLRVRADVGRAGFVAEVARIQREHGIPVVLDAKGPASYLIADLEEAGVNVTEAGLDDRVQADADLCTAVKDGTVEHANTTDLNEAIDAAGWRAVGDRRVFARKNGDISSLEAASWALWAAEVLEYDLLDSVL